MEHLKNYSTYHNHFFHSHLGDKVLKRVKESLVFMQYSAITIYAHNSKSTHLPINPYLLP